MSYAEWVSEVMVWMVKFGTPLHEVVHLGAILRVAIAGSYALGKTPRQYAKEFKHAVKTYAEMKEFGKLTSWAAESIKTLPKK